MAWWVGGARRFERWSTKLEVVDGYVSKSVMTRRNVSSKATRQLHHASSSASDIGPEATSIRDTKYFGEVSTEVWNPYYSQSSTPARFVVSGSGVV